MTGTVGGLEMPGGSGTGEGYVGLGVSAKGGVLGGLEGLGGMGPMGLGVDGAGVSATTATVDGLDVEGVCWVGAGGRADVSATGGVTEGVG
jgi:hypothetical protein